MFFQCDLKCPFTEQLWHSAPLAGNCIRPWGGVFPHLEQTFPRRGPPCTVWLLRATPPWALNGPFCGRLFHGFCMVGLEWAALCSTIPWLLVGLAPAQASFDGANTACCLPGDGLLACWLFTASLWRTDAIAFPSSTSGPSVAFLTAWHLGSLARRCGPGSSRRGMARIHSVPRGCIGRWWTNRPSRRPFAYAGWIWPFHIIMTLRRLVNCRSKPSRTVSYFFSPLLWARTNEEVIGLVAHRLDESNDLTPLRLTGEVWRLTKPFGPPNPFRPFLWPFKIERLRRSYLPFRFQSSVSLSHLWHHVEFRTKDLF